jgi:predicted glutamine amidotransferase
LDVFQEFLNTGYYSLGSGIVKASIPAKDFINKQYIHPGIANERFFIGHCRAASSSLSTVKDDKNAHPFESKNWVMVHNGTVHLDKLANYPYTSDVDSESILAYTERTSLKNAIASIEGSAALVLYSKTQKKLFFYTDGGRPLCIAMYRGIIFFASTKKILLKTLGVKNELGIFPNISFATVYERELLEFDVVKNKFSRKGVIEEKKKKASVVTYTSDESDDSPATSSHIDHNYRSYANRPIGVTSFSREIKPTIVRGCGSNPKDPNSKIVRIGNSGQKLITYKGSKN